MQAGTAAADGAGLVTWFDKACLVSSAIRAASYECASAASGQRSAAIRSAFTNGSRVAGCSTRST